MESNRARCQYVVMWVCAQRQEHRPICYGQIHTNCGHRKNTLPAVVQLEDSLKVNMTQSDKSMSLCALRWE